MRRIPRCIRLILRGDASSLDDRGPAAAHLHALYREPQRRGGPFGLTQYGFRARFRL